MNSPLLPYPPAPGIDTARATAAELDTLTDLARQRGALTITIGAGRTPAAAATADAFAERWRQLGGQIAATITWPETAASWLRQATRFADTHPDLWVMTGPALGWAQMTRRLLWSTTWTPRRTLVTAAAAAPSALELVGTHHLDGLTGVYADGTAWSILDGLPRLLPRSVYRSAPNEFENSNLTSRRA